MSRNTWAISTFESGGSFVSDGTIHVPNFGFETPTVSNQVKTKLADGSNSFTLPAIKSTKQPIVFLWESVDKAFITKIEGYVQTGDILKITDQNADNYFGKFIDSRPVWLVGVVGDYDFQAIFEQQNNPE